MKKTVFVIGTLFALLIFSDQVLASEMSGLDESLKLTYENNIIENMDTKNDDANLNAYIYCHCARYNIGWIGRRFGIGNNNCQANNIGAICLHGENADCQSENSRCGGTDEEFDD